MTSDDAHRDDEQALLVAMFRYGVIALLVDQQEWPRGAFAAKVKEIAGETHYQPGKGALRISERTLYGWIKAYRASGIAALRPRRRSDRGQKRAVTDELVEHAAQLRRENPKRTTKTLIDILERDGKLSPEAAPHRATLDRHLDQLGASRRQLDKKSARRHIKMHFESFGDLWVGDYHHGPLVRRPDGAIGAAKLGAFIDHATRFPPSYRYYLAEDIATLRDTLLRALLTWGKPKKVYVDRGAVYRADQLAYSLKQVDTDLVHSKEYYSEGRGVIERWWQVILPFEAEVQMRNELWTLQELNQHLVPWVELRYLDEVHSELGRTPRQAIAEVTPLPIAAEAARELFLVGVDRTVHKKTHCVRVENVEFQCDSSLRGREVRVRFDPADLRSVLIFRDGQRIQRAFPRRVNEPPEPHIEEPERPPPSVDYLALLRRDFDRQLLEHARPLAYAHLRGEATFDRDAFLKVISDLGGAQLTSGTRQELVNFWEMYGPLPEDLVRIGVEHAVRIHGRNRHPQLYLHAVRTLVLAHWKTPDKESP